MKTIQLNENERIIAVVPEYCEGPGWANKPVWVYIVDSRDYLRTECLQPDEQTPELKTLFDVGATVCSSLRRSVPVKNNLFTSQFANRKSEE